MTHAPQRTADSRGGPWPRLLLACALAGASLGNSYGQQAVREPAAPRRPAAAATAAVQAPDPSEYRIQAGDALNVSVFQETDLSQKVKVSQQGTVNYPLLGPVQVGGLTVAEAEQKITGLLAKDYLVNPRVAISVDTYKARRVVVLGQVKSPGTYEIPEQESLTLIQAIGRAGGFTDIAATDRVVVIRTENGKEQSLRVNVSAMIRSGDKSKDIELKPGDVISVPETFF